MDKKILILADVHSNHTALNAVIESLDSPGETSVVCLGDVVGYGPKPNECIQSLRDLKARVIAGNHDAAACDKMSTDYFNSLARRSAEWTKNHLTESNFSYLKNLPETMSDQYFQYYHGSPEGPLTHYLRNERLAARALDAISSSRLAVGHTHQPSFYHSRNETVRGKSIRGSETIRGISTSEEIVVNPGSVGQPRDGDPRAAYLLVEEHKDERMDLSWRRIEYDIKKVQERILDAGLPQPLASRLSRGK